MQPGIAVICSKQKPEGEPENTEPTSGHEPLLFQKDSY